MVFVCDYVISKMWSTIEIVVIELWKMTKDAKQFKLIIVLL